MSRPTKSKLMHDVQPYLIVNLVARPIKNSDLCLLYSIFYITIDNSHFLAFCTENFTGYKCPPFGKFHASGHLSQTIRYA